MDLDLWARTVYRLLKPGGSLVLFEGHPLDFLWETGAPSYQLRPGATYFIGSPTKEYGFPFGAATRAQPDRPVQLTSRLWTLGETITAVAKAGLDIVTLEEHPQPFWDQFPELPENELSRLPHTILLVARR